MKARNLTPPPIGKRFGKLVVISEDEPKKVVQRGYLCHIRYVKCKCDCGNTKSINLHNLTRKNGTSTCGCSIKKNILEWGVNDSETNIYTEGGLIKSYAYWIAMIGRCLSKGRQLSYTDCSVCEEWKYFSDFKRWFDRNYNPETMEGWQLDKDILVRGNKVYSPSTCCFVPSEINKLLTKSNSSRGRNLLGVHYVKRTKKYTARLNKKSKAVHLGTFDTENEAFNAYKQAKESHIKDIANEWKERIDTKVYRALYNYKIKKTD